MLLLDTLYINNSGGKILLDYLIEELEKTGLPIHYLLDDRILGKHPAISKNEVTYLKASLLQRHKFYKKHKNRFIKVFCFGNVPPTLPLSATVYTYLHQRLFLELPASLSYKQRAVFFLKSKILQQSSKNTDFWVVQTNAMKDSLSKSVIHSKTTPVLVLPFYPSLLTHRSTSPKKGHYCYVSSGSAHKNHIPLINAFAQFSSSHPNASLQLTVSKEFASLYTLIEQHIAMGCNIINHGQQDRANLARIYASCEYLIYPSLSESFGISIVEAIECGCKVIGANLPYMLEVCLPSLTFNPVRVDSILNVLEISAVNNDLPTRQLLTNQIDALLALLKE